MIKATLLIRPLDSWAVDISNRLRTAIRVVDCNIDQNGEVSGLVEFSLDNASKGSIVEGLAKHPDVGDVHFFEEMGGAILASLKVKKWIVLTSMYRLNCYIQGAQTRKDGAIEWRLMVVDEVMLRKVVQDLEKEGCKVKLVRKSKVNEAKLLTGRQEVVIEKALEMGYFDYPRRVTGRELARRLNITQSTLYETLQDSQRKILEVYMLRRRLV